MSDTAQRYVTGRQALADVFGVDVRTVANWKREPWWQPEFQNGRRYDVPEITKALEANRDNGDVSEQRNLIRLEKERVQLEREKVFYRREIRDEARELGNTLPADVWAEFAREFLGMTFDALESIAYEFSRHVPPKLKPLVFSEDNRQPAVLQKIITKKQTQVQRWLADGEREMRDDDNAEPADNSQPKKQRRRSTKAKGKSKR